LRLDPLVGRAADLESLAAALDRERLVTLVGAAGVGKSRLARELAARAQEEGRQAVVVPVEPLAAAEHLPSAIALSLGLSLPEGAERFAALIGALAVAELLLVLDGVEHLAPALATPLFRLVGGAPRLRLLVTSQVPLGRTGECLHRLGPLPTADAVELFERRARQADQRFRMDADQAALAGEICRRLDGNPLAVELAAARVASFGLAALLANLDDRFRLLKVAGATDEPRHGVLQAAFDWSHGLLSPPEQRVFWRLGGFASSFTLEAGARAVVDEDIDTASAMDLIGRLVDRSFVSMAAGDPPRYALLETARCYARDRLRAEGLEADADRRLALAMLEILDRAYEEYWRVDEAVWLQRHEPEIDNLRAALAWARRNDRELAVALHGSAWPLFVEADLQSEARVAHEEAVALLAGAAPGARVARFWEAVATYDSERQVDRARYAAELAAQLHAAAGDARSECYALLQAALNGRDDPESAGRALAAARRLEQASWPARLLAHGALVEGAILTDAGRYADARDAYRRALDRAVATSERQSLAAAASIVELDIASGSLSGALQLARPLATSLRYAGRRETRMEVLALLLGALLLAGEAAEAHAVAVEILDLAARQDTGKLYLALDAMGLLAALDGNPAVAARIAASSDAANLRHGQSRRRPAAACVRVALEGLLAAALGANWRGEAATGPAPGEVEACRMALGRAD
jgi:predicted ATPase